MLFLSGCLPASPDARATLRRLGVGLMAQPRSYGPDTYSGWTWAADNGCFTEAWDPDQWVDWLDRARPIGGCLFAVCPDVVGDAPATRQRLHEWAPIIRDLGYPVAWAAQNGATIGSAPWDEIDAVFIGGDTAWKLGHQAETIVRHAKGLGLWAHVGRVNTLRRMRIVQSWGTDSIDGTILKYGPDINTARLARALGAVNTQPTLLEGLTA